MDNKDQLYDLFEATSDVDNEWIDFISRMSDATIYHHPAWLKILEDETGQQIIRLICRDGDKKLVGILPLQYTKGFPLGLGGVLASKRLSSLPRTPIGGPLVENNIIGEMLIRKAIEIARKDNNKCLLQVKSYDDTLHNKIFNLSRYFWRETYLAKIPSTQKEIRFGNSKNHSGIKWAVNKALQNNIKARYSCSEGDLIRWYELYAETMRFHAVPARSIYFFRSIWKHLMPLGLAQLILAESEEKNKAGIIAGSILLRYKKIMVHAFNGSKRNAFDLRPNDLLHWTAIHDAQREGFEYYDLGEVAEGHEGLASYKKKWASEKRPLYHFYYPEPDIIVKKSLGGRNILGVRRKLWNFLPLKVTTIIGQKVCNYL